MGGRGSRRAVGPTDDSKLGGSLALPHPAEARPRWIQGFTAENGSIQVEDQGAATSGSALRFMAVHVFIDSHEAPLAAYQFDLIGRGSDVKVVGLEGAEHRAFADAPYYDPKAMMGDRVIVAAFSTITASQLPKGRVRVATVHLQVANAADPQFEVTLTTAANADGEKIAADISIQKGIEQ